MTAWFAYKLARSFQRRFSVLVKIGIYKVFDNVLHLKKQMDLPQHRSRGIDETFLLHILCFSEQTGA